MFRKLAVFIAKKKKKSCERLEHYVWEKLAFLNPLTPNDHYSGRTAPLTSKCFILYIYSTNIGTEYFEHVIYSPFISLQNPVCFIILTYLVPVLFTFYIQGVLKLKKNNSGTNVRRRVVRIVTTVLFGVTGSANIGVISGHFFVILLL